jgi:hypothetical protein
MKITEHVHVPWLSLIVDIFACTLCIIKRRENRKGYKQFTSQKVSCVCSIMSISRCVVSHHC